MNSGRVVSTLSFFMIAELARLTTVGLGGTLNAKELQMPIEPIAPTQFEQCAAGARFLES